MGRPARLSEPQLQKRNWVPLLYVIATIGAIALAYALFWWGGQGLFWDSFGYYTYGEQIAREGLFSFANAFRPYGYGLFVAIIWTFTNHYPSIVRFAVFNVQLVIFLIACFYASRVFQRAFKSAEFGLAVFLVAMLNVYLLIGTTQVASDLLSAILVFLAIVLCIELPANTQVGRLVGGRVRRANVARNAFLSLLVVGFAAMVRPANAAVILAVVIVWIVRWRFFRDISIWLFPVMLLVLCIPFIPQTINNYRAYGQLQPLVVRAYYSEQVTWGMAALKFNGIVIPGQARGVIYQNPFLPQGVSTPLRFILMDPAGFVLTELIHVFAMFDSDFVFPAILDMHPWYRWPLSILNYSFLFLATGGIIAWGRRFLQRRRLDRLTLVFGGVLLGSIFYLIAYVSVQIEERFAWPLYLLLSPFFVFGLAKAREVVVSRQWASLGFRTSALGAFLVCSVFLSNWIQAQAPDLYNYQKAVPLERFTTHDVNYRFGERVELQSYALDQAQTAIGGDSLYVMFNWRCNGASTESYDVQVNLLDSKDRVWAVGFHDTRDPISPCIAVPWGPGDEVSDLITFHPSPTMPAGEYKINVGIYDPERNRYLDVRDSNGNIVGGYVATATVPIAKNKTSYTFSDLQVFWPIEQPYFVDMQEMRLLGYTEMPDQISAGSELDLGLYWRARGKPCGDYLVDVQLRDASDSVVFEQSARPAEGTYPTMLWNQGEVLLDWHTLSLPSTLAPGDDQVTVILQDANSQDRIGEAKLFKISVTQ